MNKENLFNRVADISNSMFPLVDFFNDIEQIKDKDYNKEQAYKDIEKICDVVEQLLDDSRRKVKLEKYVYEKILKRLKRQYKYPEKIIEEIRFHDTYEEYAIEYVDDIKKDKKDIPITETEFNLLKEMR